MLRLGLRATVRLTNRRPPKGFDPYAHSWSVVLSYRGRRLTAPFFTGPFRPKPPDPCKVLETLLDDAGAVEDASGWEDWAANLGYPEETHPATLQRLYKRTVRQTEKLRRFLGDEYDTLLYPEDMEDVTAWCRGQREL